MTGLGAVSTSGSGVERAWDALEQKVPAGRPVDDAGVAGFAAAVPETYRPHPDIPRNLTHFLDAGALYALDAALQAIASAGLGAGAGDARRFGVADGLAFRAPGQPTLFVPYGQLVGRMLGVRGAVLEVGGAEASGMAAIAAAARLVSQDQADVVVAGAAQAIQGPILEFVTASGMTNGDSARPYDAAHAGLTPGEAAAYVVIEAESTALERGATVLARIAGVGELFDAAAEPLAVSDPAESGRAMQAALADAGFLQNQVDLVVSCGDGRTTVDFSEGYGIRRTFGRHAHYAGVTSVAGALGQALAASGPLSVVMAVEAMRRQRAFPLTGFETPEADLELAYIGEARDERLDCVLVTSLGMGGTNVSFVLTRG